MLIAREIAVIRHSNPLYAVFLAVALSMIRIQPMLPS